MKLIAGGVELQEKWSKTIQAFTKNIDQDDPEFITLREAFMQRFKEHGFVINSIDEFTEHSKALDEVLKKLDELKKRIRYLYINIRAMLNLQEYISVFEKRIKKELS